MSPTQLVVVCHKLLKRLCPFQTRVAAPAQTGQLNNVANPVSRTSLKILLFIKLWTSGTRTILTKTAAKGEQILCARNPKGIPSRWDGGRRALEQDSQRHCLETCATGRNGRLCQ